MKKINKDIQENINDEVITEETVKNDNQENINDEVITEEAVKNDNQEIDLLGNRIKSLEESLLRNQAELLNYKRRKEEEVSRMLKYANEDIVLEFLPILDNFERALTVDESTLSDEVNKFLVGIKMVYSQTKILLEKYEVKEILAQDIEFDANYHQAIMTGCDKDKPNGIILEVLQKGYIYKDKVIRPSMVKVNKIDE